MDWRLDDLRLFVEVVQAGSFAEAARRLGVPRPSVSRRIAALEEQAGVSLIWRTTRRMRPTDVGADFHRRCVDILAEADAAARALTRAAARPSGTLRIAAPPVIGPRVLGPVVQDFLARHPDVSVDLQIGERTVDLRAAGFDVGLRLGPVTDGHLIARRIGTVERVVCCSPALLGGRAPPAHPDALRDLPFVVFSECRDPTVHLRRGAETVEVRPAAPLFTNHLGVVAQALRGGALAGVVPRGVVADALAAGDLVQLVPGWSAGSAPVHVVVAAGPHRAPKVAAFLALLAEAAPTVAA